jgi:replicative DNA helicase
MFIHREDIYYTPEEWESRFPDKRYPKNVAELIVAKHRHGPVGTVRLLFRDNLVRFDPVPVEDQDF